MPLYRWGADNLDPVSPTTFEAESIQEADLQRLLRDQPEVLEGGTVHHRRGVQQLAGLLPQH